MTLMPRAADVSQWDWTNRSDVVIRNESVKPSRSTDCRLKLAYMKLEFVVIIHQKGMVKVT